MSRRRRRVPRLPLPANNRSNNEGDWETIEIPIPWEKDFLFEDGYIPGERTFKPQYKYELQTYLEESGNGITTRIQGSYITIYVRSHMLELEFYPQGPNRELKLLHRHRNTALDVAKLINAFFETVEEVPEEPAVTLSLPPRFNVRNPFAGDFLSRFRSAAAESGVGIMNLGAESPISRDGNSSPRNLNGGSRKRGRRTRRRQN
jgi:hypothetical protein